ncbi:hypothetical protein SME02_004961 [Klebsiella aerogenes]|nr:hypothetical protein [Klebsiella aerogenes]ELY3087855.1 hypothetical protein [Klebsiella aerogenes]
MTIVLLITLVSINSGLASNRMSISEVDGAYVITDLELADPPVQINGSCSGCMSWARALVSETRWEAWIATRLPILDIGECRNPATVTAKLRQSLPATMIATTGTDPLKPNELACYEPYTPGNFNTVGWSYTIDTLTITSNNQCTAQVDPPTVDITVHPGEKVGRTALLSVNCEIATPISASVTPDDDTTVPGLAVKATLGTPTGAASPQFTTEVNVDVTAGAAATAGHTSHSFVINVTYE